MSCKEAHTQVIISELQISVEGNSNCIYKTANINFFILNMGYCTDAFLLEIAGVRYCIFTKLIGASQVLRTRAWLWNDTFALMTIFIILFIQCFDLPILIMNVTLSKKFQINCTMYDMYDCLLFRCVSARILSTLLSASSLFLFPFFLILTRLISHAE